MWTIDLKKEGKVYKGKAKPKADVTLIMSDETLTQIAAGKVRPWPFPLRWQNMCLHFLQLDGQKAFMTGKLKTKGNMMLATKLGGVLGVRSSFLIYSTLADGVSCML